MLRPLHIGTTNPGKLRELGALLAPLGLELRPIALDIPEPADTFEENARLKALAYAAHVGELAIAEDSGIVVPALGGLPGPWSARFSDLILDADHHPIAVEESGRDRDAMDQANIERVLALMANVAEPHRAARFVVRLVVAEPGAILFEAGGESHGSIATEQRGERGFGYDSIFIGQDTFGKTYGELDPVRKNLRSHRKRVMNELQFWLAKRLREGA